MTPMIEWDREKLEKFKEAYYLAALGRGDFEFDGREFDFAYAGYLIEYLDSKLT